MTTKPKRKGTSRVAQAYAELDVRPADAAAIGWLTPHIAALLDGAGAADLHIPNDPYFYLRAAPGPIARAVMSAYDRIPCNLAKHLPLEAFVVAAAADPNQVADLICASLAAVQRRMVTVKFSSSHTAVADKTISVALTDDGWRDRVMVHKIMGALPAPKGAQTIVNVQQNAPAIAVVAAPPAEQTIRRLSERLAAARPALPPPADVVDVVEEGE